MSQKSLSEACEQSGDLFQQTGHMPQKMQIICFKMIKTFHTACAILLSSNVNYNNTHIVGAVHSYNYKIN